MNKLKALNFLYVLGIIALFFYSFTQVDLNLTLSKVSVFQTIEKQFQYLGFFQRPASAVILLLIFTILSVSYLALLYYAKKDKLNIKKLAKIIVLTSLLLIFSYTAFSYDLFNYIFDAKIVTFYHQSPYLHKALDFPQDSMLHFMRWTHRIYPYGPNWLILTIPLSFLGFGLFLPTFFLFKALMGVSFLGSAFLIYKISQKVFPKNAVLNTVAFAFNPLIVLETLVSAHNDMPMIFFILLSIYLFLLKKQVYSWMSNLFSIGIKYSTGVLLPLFILLEYLQLKGKTINWEKFFSAALVLSLLTVIIATLRTTFQSWYLLFPLAMASFIFRKPYVQIASVIASFFAISLYIPYVYLSDYASGYPQTIQNIQVLGLVTLGIFLITYPLKTRFFRKR